MGLVDRAKAILLTPSKEWQVIDGESTSVAALFTGYVIPLAAIPALARFIGWSLIGFPLPLVGSIKIPMGTGLSSALVGYVITVAGVYVLGLIIDALAPNFGGTKNQIQALKVAAYSGTASWIAGIFLLIPSLSMLSILGIYSLYLLYVGLPILMKAPADKAMGYTVVVIVVAFIIAMISGYVASSMVGYGRFI